MKKLEDKIIDSIERIPTIRPVALEVIRVCSDKNISIPLFLKIVSSDQSLALQILRIANAGFYNYPGTISSLDRAAIVLGFELLKDIALYIAIDSINSEISMKRDDTPDKLWGHAYLSGFTMKVLAENFDSENKDILYMGGLLHDCGKIVFWLNLNQEYDLLVQKSRQENVSLHDLERRYFGINHTDVGARLIQKWNLPSALSSMAKYHHTPSAFDAEEKIGYWIKLLYLANKIAHQIEERRPEPMQDISLGGNGHPGLSLSGKEMDHIKSLVEKEIQEQTDNLNIFEVSTL